MLHETSPDKFIIALKQKWMMIGMIAFSMMTPSYRLLAKDSTPLSEAPSTGEESTNAESHPDMASPDKLIEENAENKEDILASNSESESGFMQETLKKTELDSTVNASVWERIASSDSFRMYFSQIESESDFLAYVMGKYSLQHSSSEDQEEDTSIDIFRHIPRIWTDSKEKDIFVYHLFYPIVKDLYLEWIQEFPDEPFLISGYRSYAYQSGIWNYKRNQLKQKKNISSISSILDYSAYPGTSRHHWGFDIDIWSVEPKDWATPQGEKIYTWLQEHLPNKQLCQVYKGTPNTQNTSPKHFREEKWHWSYQPATSVIMDFLTQKYQKEKDSLIQQFTDQDENHHLNFQEIKDYIFEISEECVSTPDMNTQ